MYILLIILGIVLMVGLWFIIGYNRFVHLKALINEALSGIDTQLKRRNDLIPNLVATVKGYSVHEKSIIEEIVRMRAASVGATNINEKASAEAGLTQSLKTLFAIAEQYPDLKANTNFLELQKELSAIEQELSLARRYYNGAARNYNVAVASFPSRIIASVGGFEQVPYFEAHATERETPKVHF